MKKLRMIALLRQVADLGIGGGARWAQMRMHRIMTDALAKFGAPSKLNDEWEFVATLHEEGQHAASEFLKTYVDDLGRRSTADIDVSLVEC
jgi:NTE family protein